MLASLAAVARPPGPQRIDCDGGEHGHHDVERCAVALNAEAERSRQRDDERQCEKRREHLLPAAQEHDARHRCHREQPVPDECQPGGEQAAPFDCAVEGRGLPRTEETPEPADARRDDDRESAFVRADVVDAVVACLRLTHRLVALRRELDARGPLHRGAPGRCRGVHADRNGDVDLPGSATGSRIPVAELRAGERRVARASAQRRAQARGDVDRTIETSEVVDDPRRDDERTRGRERAEAAREVAAGLRRRPSSHGDAQQREEQDELRSTQCRDSKQCSDRGRRRRRGPGPVAEQGEHRERDGELGHRFGEERHVVRPQRGRERGDRRGDEADPLAARARRAELPTDQSDHGHGCRAEQTRHEPVPENGVDTDLRPPGEVHHVRGRVVRAR